MEESCVDDGVEKRKLDTSDDSSPKKTKTENGVINVNNHSIPDQVSQRDTQSYDLEDSEGFDIASAGQTLKDEIDQSAVTAGEPAVEELDGTLENSQGFSPSPEQDDFFKGDGNKSDCDTGTKLSVTQIVSVQRDAELISSIIPGTDFSQIYDKVLANRGKDNRVDIVTNQVLEGELNSNNSGVKNTDARSDNEDSLFKDLAEVLVSVPSADPNQIYDLLEKRRNEPGRVRSVISWLTSELSETKLSTKSAAESNSNTSTNSDLFNDPAFMKNPLYKDVKILHKVLQDRDANEIYAYLEAHFDRPNRVQIVLEELTKSDSEEALPVQAKESLENMTDRGKGPMTAEDKMHLEINELRQIFPDCDPNYLYEKLDEKSDDPERVAKLATELFETKKYPKFSEAVEEDRKIALKKSVENLQFNMEDFLKKFPSPLEYFANKERPMSLNYKNHVEVFLKNEYRALKDGYIKKVLEEHKFHLAPSVTAVDEMMTDIEGRRSKKLRVTPRATEIEYPEIPDELFFQEVMFCQHQGQIKDYIEKKRRQKEVMVEDARNRGELHECGCCFDDECLFEDMRACGDGHLFCIECICRSCEAALGQGKADFLCLTGTCEYKFPLTILQEILPASVFSLALRKLQEEEVRQADIPDLVSCPFCSFATIMPDASDRVLKCLNQECLKESCRLCKEPSHIPLRCDEVEKQGETTMRAYIESKMSEAMLRKCPRCKKRFYKDSGCNKMTCACGTTMCYVCRTPNIDYSHFDQTGDDASRACPIDSDIMELHKEEMMKAAAEAKAEYLRDHPDAMETELKYDPVKLVEQMKKGQYLGDSYDDEEVYSDADSDADDSYEIGCDLSDSSLDDYRYDY